MMPLNLKSMAIHSPASTASEEMDAIDVHVSSEDHLHQGWTSSVHPPQRGWTSAVKPNAKNEKKAHGQLTVSGGGTTDGQ